MSTHILSKNSQKPSNIDQEKIDLRIKLDDLSVLLKKLANGFLNLESDNGIILLESKDSHDLLGLANELQSFKSLDGKEGEVFVSFMKDSVNIIQNIGTILKWEKQNYSKEVFTRVLVLLRNLEEQIKEFMPTIISIDESRKEKRYETFGGLLQKLVDAIEEKRHLILSNVED